MSKIGRVALFFALVSLACFVVVRSILGVWVPFLWIPLGFLVISTPAWLYYDRNLLKEFFSLKTTKNGMSMGLLILLVIVAIGLVNFLGARNFKTFDFSMNQVNSLSEQSKKVIADLDDELKIQFFYKSGLEGVDQSKSNFARMVALYQDQSAKVKYEMIEVNDRPKLAQDYGVKNGRGEAYVLYKDRKNRIDKFEEQELTNAIIKVTRKNNKKVYFVEGHGERSIDDERNEFGAFSAKSLVEKNSFDVQKISFVQTPKVPQDADAIVILGPVQNFQAFEIKAIEDYLLRGGNLMIALEGRQSAGLESLLAKIGVSLDPHYVYNLFDSQLGSFVDQRMPTVGSVFSAQNEVTKVFKANEMVVFRQPGSFSHILPSPVGIVLDDIVKTPTAAVALKELDSKEPEGAQKSFVLGISAKGKLTAAGKDFQVLLYSDSDFASNMLLMQNLNRDLFLNSVSMLAKEEGLISVSAKEPSITKMAATPTLLMILVFAFFIPLPLSMLVTSVVLYFKRRHA